jgi:hypothetical protein
LNLLRHDESAKFWRVAAGDESWFSDCYQSAHCDAKSGVEVPPRAKTTIATQRAIATVFFTGKKLLVLDVLPRTEIQLGPFSGHECTRIIQGKYERQAESLQELSGRTRE